MPAYVCRIRRDKLAKYKGEQGLSSPPEKWETRVEAADDEQARSWASLKLGLNISRRIQGSVEPVKESFVPTDEIECRLEDEKW